MGARTVSATQFKAECLKLIDEINESHEALTITRRGHPVAVLSPAGDMRKASLIGALQGVVARYDDPFAPAADADDWAANS